MNDSHDAILDAVRFDANGLAPAVAQDHSTGQVLMLAYMDREALRLTLETGLAHYYSRSRGRIWKKGESSGHVQRVRRVLIDCDEDALLLTVDQEIAACHKGYRSCFHREISGGKIVLVEERVFDPDKVYEDK